MKSPADIPLVTVQKAKKTATVKIEPPPQTEETPQDLQQTAEHLHKKALQEADSLQKQAKQEADNLHKQAQKEATAKIKAASLEAEEKVQAAATEAKTKIAEAESILAKAESKAQSMMDKAKRQGYQEGQQEGLALYQQQTAEAAEQLKHLLAELAQEREVFFDGFEGQMVELALKIAEKIVLTAINKDDTAFTDMITNALKHMRHESKISIHVSEQQYNDFFNAESANYVLDSENIHVAIIKDPRMENGGLILESDEETINAGAASQLKYISLAFGRPAEKY